MDSNAAALERATAADEVVGCLQRVQGKESSGGRHLGAEQHCVGDGEGNIGQPLPQERLEAVPQGGS